MLNVNDRVELKDSFIKSVSGGIKYTELEQKGTIQSIKELNKRTPLVAKVLWDDGTESGCLLLNLQKVK